MKEKLVKVIGLIKKYKKFIYIAAIVLVAIIILSNIREAVERKEVLTGYTKINDVPGISFQVEKKVIDESTAVMEISKKVDFSFYNTYLYKNGTDMYLLFNMNEFVVIAKKGTTFHFEENGITKGLEDSSLNGTWFTLNGKEKDVKKEGNRYELDVNAQVVITNDIYNDFVGKLVVINDLYNEEECEWSLFVGSLSKKNAFYEENVINTVASLAISDTEKHILDNYEIDINSGMFASAEVVNKDEPEMEVVNPSTQPEEDKDSQQELPPGTEPSQEEPTQPEEPESTEPETDVSDIEEPEVIEPEVIQPEVVEPSTEDKEEEIESSKEEEKESEEPGEDGTEGSVVVPVEKDDFYESNQTIIVKEETKAYTSSIYSMLNVGDIAYMDIMSNETATFEGAYIKIKDVLNKEETEKAVADYIASGKAYYSQMKAKDGCHLEAVVYDVKYKTDYDMYTDIRILGLDGEDLRFRGIKYSHKTYDILSSDKKDGWIVDNICFYEVPNGCKEYVIKCGDGKSEVLGFGAYYHIVNE